MASLDTGDGGGHKKGPGVKKAKKLSTRVDMTPMVDLGFLLITFFIFTSTMSSPTTMDLNMPKDTDKKEEETKVKMSGALTIMLGRDNNLFYYEGELTNENASQAFKSASFKEIRDVIIKKKKEVESRYVTDPACEAKAKQDGKNPNDCRQKDFFVLIKPTEEANYKGVIDLLDEMTINKVARYALLEPFDTEKELITASQGAAPATPAATTPPAQ